MCITNEIFVNEAKRLGFDLAGFAPAEKLNRETELLEKWLERGYNGNMGYMEKVSPRRDVNEILPGAKTVISLAMNYYTPEEHDPAPGEGKVSRYAWGKDYHLVIWEKLDRLVERLKETDPGFEAKTYVDTGPVMDKAWAVHAGIGWLGKHTNVINRNIGSWFFIATVICNYEFGYNLPEQDLCGSCRKCLDACPTGAITGEYIVDATRCISYLTIENKNEIPEKFRGKFDNWIFGCDICQDVCPWNKKFSLETDKEEFRPINKELKFDELKPLSNRQFQRRFAGSPILRPRAKGMRRNAEFLEKERGE